MGAVPKAFRLSEEDLGKNPPDWAGQLVGALGTFVTQVVGLLTKGLNRTDNMVSVVREFDLKTGGSVAASFPYDLSHSLSVTPTAVWIAQVYPDNGNLTMTDPVTITSWRVLAAGQIRIAYLTGLAVNQTYRVRLILE